MANWYKNPAKDAGRKINNAVKDAGRMTKNAVKDTGRKLSNIGKDITGVTAAENAAEEERKALADGQSSLERMFDKSQATQKPWLDAGQRGLNQLEGGINSGQFIVHPWQRPNLPKPSCLGQV